MNKDRRSRVAEVMNDLEELKTLIKEIRDEEQEAMDNIPESLQGTDRYSDMETAIDALESAENGIEAAISSLEEIG